MAKYTIYVIEGGKPTDVKAVSEGRWNMSALKFGLFWLLYNKLWKYFFVTIFIYIGLLVYFADLLNILSVLVTWFLMSCVISLHADEMLDDKLKKDFYQKANSDLIEADSADEAAKKYIREQALAEQFEEKEEEIIDAEVEEEGVFSSFIFYIGLILMAGLTIVGIRLLAMLFTQNF